ncbi:MAG: hypothetical protein NTY64_12830 [Deltaproteobacteria bacterium]|nr:hypothetical protein [Deltaproteobacteria bacterium]
MEAPSLLNGRGKEIRAFSRLGPFAPESESVIGFDKRQLRAIKLSTSGLDYLPRKEKGEKPTGFNTIQGGIWRVFYRMDTIELGTQF